MARKKTDKPKEEVIISKSEQADKIEVMKCVISNSKKREADKQKNIYSEMNNIFIDRRY